MQKNKLLDLFSLYRWINGKKVNYLNLTQVISTLTEHFSQPLNDGEQRKIIFWFDKDNEFAEDIDQIAIDNVKVHQLTEKNNFYTKYLLEEEDPTSHYLIYTNLELGVEDNWVIDTVLYSKTFYADKISLLLNDLHIDSSLRMVVKKYEKFFNNKDRYKKFQAFSTESFTEETIEMIIMAVLCNVKTLDFETIVKTVLMDSLNDEENKYLELLEKFFDTEVFWKYVANHYGYERETNSLKMLFMHLTVTALSHSIDESYLSNIKDYIAQRNKTNGLVFIDHWMHHKTDYEVYNEYAKLIEQEIQLSDLVNQISVESFKQADIFPYFDRTIIIYIANSLSTNLEDYEEYIKLIKLRRAKHFYETYENIYEALYYTVKIHQFYKEQEARIPQGQAVEMYEAYVNKYYVMDTYYRKFYVAYDQESNNELLKKLKLMVENIYTNWYQGELSSHWSQAVSTELREQWSLPGVSNQQDFYRNIVSSKMSKGERVFVIISDAMRYEVGVEISERLNAETLGSCEVETMLGVIPSVTKLGMASLLPYRSIDFDGNARVLVDGKDSSGLENRKKIIAKAESESVAIHFQDVFNMNKAGRREYFKGKKLIYIYHDTIDAMGDKASTEIYTFNAVEKAMNEIYDLVKIIRDDLSGVNIYITADHGFLYQREALEESDKMEKEKLDTIEVKRRYMLSTEKREVSGLLNIDLSSVVKNEQQLTAYVPNATIRFKIQGSGVNFVHGGASLQEVVVPLLMFKNKRSGQKGTKEIKKVDIKLTNTTRKITNSIFNLSFFQTEKVEEKMIARTVVIYMADEDGSVISNEETIIGDREFDNPEDRTFKLRFVLKSIPYDRGKTYYLVIKDTETQVTVDRIPFTINLGIVSDFDF
ncbi:BREX-1 system phosphatase PglZ type A [Alkalihalobacterium bogoriense]|uniref:BREX-1 system phosphatase PglZ type A n=1 Tax=Alkalihalobacterium bogoriense TaxID=246272 RepID=UPI0027E4C23B|nr:BREX-1 system phosphatase PglZ type A [Alkalihalobacterium bogoriense]